MRENIKTYQSPKSDVLSRNLMPLSYIQRIFGLEREVWVVFVLALAIYLPGIWWGLPHASTVFGVHSWEIDAVTGMQTLSELHNLFIQPKPDWYLAYPPFHYLLIGVFYVPYFIWLYLSGGISQISAQYPFGLTDPVTTLKHLTLIGRTITLLMASGIVVNAFLIGQTIWDKQTARLSALTVALPTTMVFYARTGNLDVPVLFWMSLTILILAKCLQFGFTPRRAKWLGIVAALAVATKDSAYGALTVGLLMLVILHFRRKNDDSETTSRWKAPVVLFISGGLTFILAAGLLISPNRFFGHLEFVRNFDKTFYNVIHLNLLHSATIQGYAALSFDIGRELFIALGPIFLIAGLIGLVVSWRSSSFSKVLFVMLIGYLFLVIFPIRHMQFRYIMFPAFVFAFFIARAIVSGLQQQQKSLRTAALLTMIIGFGWMSFRAIDLTYQMIFDARYEAGRWLAQNGNQGDKLAFFSVRNVLPPIEKEITAIPLIEDTAPAATLQKEQIRFVLVQQDWSSQSGAEHGHFFPKSLYQQIKEGSLGYQKVATFETKGLFHSFFLDLPHVTPGYIVNPSISIYELKTKNSQNHE